jgi:hypothetical protein
LHGILLGHIAYQKDILFYLLDNAGLKTKLKYNVHLRA